MSKTNCINCGAAKDTSEIKCPFCGTTYLDLTAIDFSSNEPVVCEFVMPYNVECKCRDGDVRNGKAIVRMFAVPRLEDMSVQNEYATITGFGGQTISTFCERTEVNIGVSFHPVEMPGKSLMEMTIKPDDNN